MTERVRWSDCDPLGIIHYGAYIRLFEVAEHEFFRALGLPYAELRERRGVWLPRKAFQVEFHSPARMDEAVALGVRVARVGTTSLTLAFRAAEAATGTPRATASLTVVCVARDGLAAYPVPAWLRDALAPYTDAG